MKFEPEWKDFSTNQILDEVPRGLPVISVVERTHVVCSGAPGFVCNKNATIERNNREGRISPAELHRRLKQLGWRIVGSEGRHWCCPKCMSKRTIGFKAGK